MFVDIPPNVGILEPRHRGMPSLKVKPQTRNSSLGILVTATAKLGPYDFQMMVTGH